MIKFFNSFNKNKDDNKKEDKKVEAGDNIKNESTEGMAFAGVGGAQAHKILKGFYISEKSSLGNNFNQYMFKVFSGANKSEVKKEVAKLFNVKVKNIKMLNMPEKRRDFGRHPGTKSGFKKAVVVLEKGYTIGQAKP